MFYVDSQRTITRRDSSLITPRKLSFVYSPRATTCSLSSTQAGNGTDSRNTIQLRPKGSVEQELVTSLFESMLNHIVLSWEVIVSDKPEKEIVENEISDITIKKKGRDSAKSTKFKSKVSKDTSTEDQVEPFCVWWSGADERAIIHFRNGNLYEGAISKKSMHGEGRYQWADGTVYLGQFNNNQIVGKGVIHWKDDTWYEGEFFKNLRHGRGLYVNSRTQGYYIGDWHLGTKHGQGVIYYTRESSNNYDGEWDKNVRHGYGSREYSHSSGYKGEWNYYLREGQGLMIWPNHDFYSGNWKNNVMSGFGVYIWEVPCNESMSLPSINIFRGEWVAGKRNGYGVLNLGSGLGMHYKGQFKNNMKHGVGKLVTNNGQVLEHKALFIDDNFGPSEFESRQSGTATLKQSQLREQMRATLVESQGCPSLTYHVQHVLNNIDRQAEIRAHMIRDFREHNKYLERNMFMLHQDKIMEDVKLDVKDFIDFEDSSLRKALLYYGTDLKKIYYQYAKIYNTKEISFTPNLIRLYLWQLYFDCNLHNKGLTLVEIDNLLSPEWISTPHNPFEKVYFWQFLHSLIAVASKLYAKREVPGPKPDTILASAFRTFVEKDVLPGTHQHKGHLVNGYGAFVTLKGVYALYKSIGEPHTVRDFMRAARRSHHDREHPQPPLIEAPDRCIPVGCNAFVIGDEMTYSVGSDFKKDECDFSTGRDLKLFNFGNISCQAIIKIFANIFPQILVNNKIMDLDVEITFFEFFEAFIACAVESIRKINLELALAPVPSAKAVNALNAPRPPRKSRMTII